MYVNVVDESAYAAVGVSLLSAYIANAALEADLGESKGGGGPYDGQFEAIWQLAAPGMCSHKSRDK